MTNPLMLKTKAARRRAMTQESKTPSSHLIAIDDAGFQVLRYQGKSLAVKLPNGEIRMEWLPKDLVNWEKQLFVRWCEDDTYDFPGWEPQKGFQFGGRYRTVQQALAWFEWLERAT